MRRRLPAVVALVTFGCQTAIRPPRTEPIAPGQKPNVILILTDDMDMSPLPYMTTLESELSDRGTTFSNSFVTDPVCCPSRVSTLTGLYVHNHGVLDNKPPLGGYRVFVNKGHEQAHIGLWMKAAGYRTGLVGKYMNRYPGVRNLEHVPPGWDEWHALFFPETYENYRLNDNGRINEFAETDEEYQTDVLSQRTLDFVKSTPSGKPFFLYLAPFAPHAPAQPHTRHENALPGLKAPRPPSFDEEDVSDKPEWVQRLPRLSPQTAERTDDWHRRRVQTLLAVDELIAKLIETLRQQGQLENTYLFFTSDNGFQLGAHRLDHGKGDPYEESIRVPMIVRGPGVPAGRTLPHSVLNIDLAPTFLALAGADPPHPLDGRSLTPLLGGRPPEPGKWRQDFLVEHWDSGKTRQRDTEDDGGIPEYSALRTETHTYVEYPKTNERELYDLRKDPFQMQSIHGDASAARLEQLSKRLAVLRQCKGESC